MQYGDPTASDETLARDARNGSVAAFEALVYRFEERIYHYLTRKVGCARDAEDLAQQVFVKAYRGLDRFDPSRPFAPWLFTIAHRETVSHYRARRPEQGVEVERIDHATPSTILSERESAQDLWQWARSQLSADQFSSLWLRVQEEFSIKDIARSMGRSQTSVKVQLHRARRRLAKAWPPGAKGGEQAQAGLTFTAGALTATGREGN